MAFLKGMIEQGKYYDHRKNPYQVIGGAKNAVTLTEVVIYEALYKNPVSQYWVIPLAKFKEKILVNGKRVPRFIKAGQKPNPLKKNNVDKK